MEKRPGRIWGKGHETGTLVEIVGDDPEHEEVIYDLEESKEGKVEAPNLLEKSVKH